MEKTKITEADYILVSDLTRLRIAYDVLREVLPETSPIIGAADMQRVMKQLSEWRDAHVEATQGEDED